MPKIRTKADRNTILLFAFILVQILIISWYIFNHYFDSAMFDSDAAAEILLAETISKSGNFIFEPGWFYSTEVRVIHNHLVMAPIFFFTDNYAIVHGVSCIIIMLLLLVAGFYGFSSLEISKKNALLCAISFILPYGAWQYYSFFSVYVGAAYYSFFLFNTLLLLGLYIRCRRSFGRKRIVYLVLIALLGLVMGLAGVRYAYIAVLPIALAELLDLKFGADSPLGADWKRANGKGLIGRLLIPIVLGVLWTVGFLIFRRVITPQLGGDDFTNLMFTSGADMVNRIHMLIFETVASFGYAFKNGRLLSLLGVGNAFLLLYVGLVLYAFFRLLKKGKELKPAFRFYMYFAVSAFVVNIFPLLFTMTPGGFDRTLWLGMMAMIPLPVLLFYIEKNFWSKFIIGVLLVGVVVVTNVFLVATAYPYENRFANSFNRDVITAEYVICPAQWRETGYLRFLQDNEMEFGLATFYNCNISTVLTNGEIRFANIFNDEDYTYSKWLMPRAYTDTSLYEPQFLLLTNGEEQERHVNGWETKGQEVYRDGIFVVYDLRN